MLVDEKKGSVRKMKGRAMNPEEENNKACTPKANPFLFSFAMEIPGGSHRSWLQLLSRSQGLRLRFFVKEALRLALFLRSDSIWCMKRLVPSSWNIGGHTTVFYECNHYLYCCRRDDSLHVDAQAVYID